MPATVHELIRSRRFSIGQDPIRELVYTVTGSNDETEVEAAVLAEAPASYSGLALERIDVEPLGSDSAWEAVARYRLDLSEDEFTFDTTGG